MVEVMTEDETPVEPESILDITEHNIPPAVDPEEPMTDVPMPDAPEEVLEITELMVPPAVQLIESMMEFLFPVIDEVSLDMIVLNKGDPTAVDPEEEMKVPLVPALVQVSQARMLVPIPLELHWKEEMAEHSVPVAPETLEEATNDLSPLA